MPIKHIGLLKPAEGKQRDLVAEIEKLGKISLAMPKVLSFSHGPYNSAEGLNQGFSYIFEVVFTDKTARDEYLQDENHKQAAGQIIANLEDPANFQQAVAVVDYTDNFLTPRTLCDLVASYIQQQETQIQAKDQGSIEVLTAAKQQLEQLKTKHADTVNRTVDLGTLFGIPSGPSVSIGRHTALQTRIDKLIGDIDKLINPPTVGEPCCIQ